MPVAENHHLDRVRPPWVAAAIADPLLLALICTCFFWKLVLTNQYSWLESTDLSYQVLPWFQFQATEWHAGRFPLWDPHLWNGQSLVGQAQPGVLYPLNWILFLLPLQNGYIQLGFLNWYFVVIHWMGAVFCYWLCRDLDRSRIASLFAGCLFAFSGYLGHIDWPQMLNGAVWTPLIFLFLLRAAGGVRPYVSAILSGTFLGISWLSGHHQIPLFLTLAAGGVWLYYIVDLEPDRLFGIRLRLPVIPLAVLCGLFSLVVGAAQILPAMEYGRTALRWVSAESPVTWEDKVPYVVHALYSFNPISLFGLVIPGWNRHTSGFVGFAGLSLAALATSLLWRQPYIRLFFAVAIGGLLFALGGMDIFHGVLYSLLPGVEKARTPSTAILIFNFGISLLTAYGMDVYRSAVPALKTIYIPRIAAGLGLFILALSMGRAFFRDHMAFGDERIILVGFCGLAIAGVMTGWRNGALSFPALAFCTFGLMILEVGMVTTWNWPHRSEHNRTIYISKLRDTTDIAEFLRKHPEGRTDIDGPEIQFNLGDWHGVDTYGGYLASLSRNLIRLPMGEPAVKRLFSVKYLVRKDPQTPEQKPVFQARLGVTVYENPDPMPRAWAVHEVASISDNNEAALAVKTWDLRKKAFLDGPTPTLQTCAGDDHVRLLQRMSGRVSLDATLACRGMVVLNDTNAPGWVTTVDGRPAQLLEPYFALRGVVVEGGAHHIEMRYRPASVLWGAGLTLAGLLSAIVFALGPAVRHKMVRKRAK